MTQAEHGRYVEFRDSGVEWLGMLPAHWEVVKGAWLGSLFGSESVPDEQVVDEGPLLFIKVSSLSLDGFDLAERCFFVSQSAFRSVRPRRDFIVFPKRGAAIFTNKVNIVRENAAIDPNLMGWMPNGKATVEYLAHLLKLRGLADIADVSTVPQINNKHINPMMFPVPPLEEQTQIAKFLDYETAKIDALIEKQQQLIELLKEKRQAVISHAVTKGLNPDAPMRDSGVEWLGKVPAHWEVLSVRHAVRIDNGPRFPINRSERAEMGGEYPYWGPTGILDHINHYRYEGERAIIGEDGDHFVKFAVWQMTQWASGRFNVNNHAHVIASGPRCSARWFYFAFLHRDIGADVVAQGVSRLKLTREGLSNLTLAVPPLHEQKHIIDYVERRLARLADGLALAQQQIELLQERRTALISAAVTGKIDVRGWKPPASASGAIPEVA